MVNVRYLTPNDNLEKAADLVFQVDPYICPDFFGDVERARKFGKILFTDDGGLFDFNHTLVAEENGELLGVLIYTDNTVTSWDCATMKAKVESLDIKIPEKFDRANKEYMELVVNAAKELEDGVVEVEWCATDLNSRGKGVAQALFKKFLELPYKEQHLTVLADNPPAIHVYEKMGFKIVSTQTGYPDDSVGTHNMIRKPIPIEISARHVHLSQHLVNVLFGEGYELTPAKGLSQPTEFLCNERVDIVGPREIIHNVAVLGPTREHTQVEIALTDARKLGLNPPIRESGDHDGSAACRIVGPAGEYELDDGVIIARRHLHLGTKEAEKLALKNGDIVSVEVKNSLRPLIFEDVLIRVKDTYSLSMHVDTDEGNAAGLTPDSYGLITK
ncbi:phosphate propanoyltransferase [Candidatus Saccharibacteria bacterium]|nr:phosphate propanoyltransferase [Candidatus Saccharibacteria bacterium]